MKKLLSLFSFLLVFVMILSVFSGCTGNGTDGDDASSEATTGSVEDGTDTSSDDASETSSESTVESASESHDDSTNASAGTETEDSEETSIESSEETSTDTSSETSEEESTESDEEGLLADIEHGELIEHANKLANSVQAYYADADRDKFVFENQNMSLEYLTDAFDDQYVSAIKNKDGLSYIENTMDIFVKMKDGSVFYAADTQKNTEMNIYRFGYYYYHVLLQGQDFASGGVVSERIGIDVVPENFYQVKPFNVEGNGYGFKITNEQDPRVIFEDFELSTDTYNAVQIKIKANVADSRSWELFIKTNNAGYSYDSYTRFLVAPSEDYNLYTVKLDAINGFDGDLLGLRFDPGGLRSEEYSIESIELVHIDDGGAANLYLNRSFHVYSDKLHHVAQIAAMHETDNIEAIGMKTEIKADSVSKVVAFDANGLHHSFDGVDWASVEYFAFDIKDVGVFGFVLPFGETDSFDVTLNDGIYTVIQSRAPEGNKIIPSEVKTSNANDFYFGQRIYTDATHSFDGFIYEATCERNPLTDKNIKVRENVSDNSAFLGYDSLRGVYVVSIAGTGFNDAYFGAWNRHYRSEITLRCDDLKRNIYMMTASTSGSLECAVLLDSNDMLLPVPLEVAKNFNGDGEDNLYNLDDANYSEAIFPLVLDPEVKYTYNVINLYQNWGQYPLKQISSIQFYMPYYHLSTGVTESNCIVPLAELGPRLPDHRAASAPFWPTQPQHTSGGYHNFLAYTDAEGKKVVTENTRSTIDSYGPTYADVVLDYVTSDGKIKVSYTHLEFPQLDENRGYYEMKYEVLEDVSFKDFKNDFCIFSMATNNKTGKYKSLGYLDENNQPQCVLANTSSENVSYILGDDCPYFDYFELLDYTDESGNGYVNISFLIYNYDFDLASSEEDPRFIINDFKNTVSLSLDLDEFTLKAGDSFTINSIIMPWGSQETVYDGSNGKAPDQNVRDVRENTFKNPLSVTAVADCEIIDSPFLPRVKSTNGKSAEFTLSGGQDNVAVRVYGFYKLTSPRFYELIDGEWVEFLVSSYANKEYDYLGNAHNYDGYMVQYDGDGTFSYSFVTTMNNGAPRTFKVVASDDFAGWEKVPEKVAYNPMNVYYDAVEFYQITGSNTHFSDIVLAPDTSYISFYSSDRVNESYIKIFENNNEVTGKYIVLKYRLPESNEKKISVVEFFASTANDSINAADSVYLSNSIIADGDWHVLIVDLEACSKGSFKAENDGSYIAHYLRFDVFNYALPSGMRFDVAYLGIHDDLDEIREINKDMETLTFANTKSEAYYMDTATGELGEKIEVIKNPTTPPTDSEVEEDTTPTIVRFDNTKIQSKAKPMPGFSDVTLAENNEYVSFFAKDGAAEGNFHMFTGGTEPTGRYIVMKYRLPSTNESKIDRIEFYISSSNSDAVAADSVYYQKCLNPDGEWHVAIFDIVAHGGSESYVLDESGNYVASYLRVDIFNSKLPEGTQFDVAYLGMTNNLDCVFEEFSDFESFSLSTSEGKTETIDKSYNAQN